uniref:Uncharacterized protein n=1 Tax=Arundo donax TaxID=35708 RepID=A0A0A9BH60_ARUDO
MPTIHQTPEKPPLCTAIRRRGTKSPLVSDHASMVIETPTVAMQCQSPNKEANRTTPRGHRHAGPIAEVPSQLRTHPPTEALYQIQNPSKAASLVASKSQRGSLATSAADSTPYTRRLETHNARGPRHIRRWTPHLGSSLPFHREGVRRHPTALGAHSTALPTVKDSEGPRAQSPRGRHATNMC